MSKLKLLLLLIVAHTLLIGADINKTIVSGDIKFYSQLEKNLDRTQPKDVLDLQKTLLNKLKTLSSKRNQDKNLTVSSSSTITNQNEYKQAFEKYLSKIVEKGNYNRELLKNQKNLASLKKQIKKDENVNLTRQLFYAYYNKRSEFLNSKLRLSYL